MKKAIIILIAVVLSIVAVSIWLLATPEQALPKFFKQFKIDEIETAKKQDTEYSPVEKTILYNEADFSENIYDDQTYLDLLGPYVMYYKKDDIEYSLTEDDVERQGIWAEFFYEYIETVKNGDNVTYNSYFFDEYYNNHEKKDEFTMQKIYDLRIEELGISPKLDEEEYSWVNNKKIEPVCFNVKYKIRQNNGTFRLGMNSDTYQSQLYILGIDKNDTVKIIDIVSYTPTH